MHYDVYGWSLNVNSTPAGIGNIMDWEKGFAEVALYESMHPSTTAPPSDCCMSWVQHILILVLQCIHYTYLFATGGDAAGPDIKKRKIVLVGVYPVVRGFAELDRKELADKGQSRFHPLYIEPGEPCAFSTYSAPACTKPCLVLTPCTGPLWAP